MSADDRNLVSLVGEFGRRNPRTYRVPPRLIRKVLRVCEDLLDSESPQDQAIGIRGVVACRRSDLAEDKLALEAQLGTASLQIDAARGALASPAFAAAMRDARNALCAEPKPPDQLPPPSDGL